MAAEDVGAVAIVKADGQILSVDRHAQVIGWDGAPATLIALASRSLEAEPGENALAEPGGDASGLASGDLQAMLDRASDGPSRSIWPAGSCPERARRRLVGYHHNRSPARAC